MLWGGSVEGEATGSLRHVTVVGCESKVETEVQSQIGPVQEVVCALAAWGDCDRMRWLVLPWWRGKGKGGETGE